MDIPRASSKYKEVDHAANIANRRHTSIESQVKKGLKFKTTTIINHTQGLSASLLRFALRKHRRYLKIILLSEIVIYYYNQYFRFFNPLYVIHYSLLITEQTSKFQLHWLRLQLPLMNEF